MENENLVKLKVEKKYFHLPVSKVLKKKKEWNGKMKENKILTSQKCLAVRLCIPKSSKMDVQ